MSVNYDKMKLPEILITKLAINTSNKLNKQQTGNVASRDVLLNKIKIILEAKLPLNNSGAPVYFKQQVNEKLFKYIGLEYDNVSKYDYIGILELINKIYDQIKDRIGQDELVKFIDSLQGSSFEIDTTTKKIKYRSHIKKITQKYPEQRDLLNPKRILQNEIVKNYYSLGGSNEYYEL